MGYRKLRSVDFNSLNTSVAVHVCKSLFNHGDNWINYKTTYWFYICTFSTIEKYAIISNCTLIWSSHVSNLTNHIIAFNYSARSALPTIIKNGYCYPSCRYLLSLLAVVVKVIGHLKPTKMCHRSCGVLEKSNQIVNAAPCWAWLAIPITWTDPPCSTPIFITNGKDSMKHLLACILHTAALNTDPDFSLWKWSHAPWKPSIRDKMFLPDGVPYRRGGFHRTRKGNYFIQPHTQVLLNSHVANCTLRDLYTY